MTPAGPTDPATTNSVTNGTASQQDNSHDMDALVNAINQVFAIFRRNYHNQYYKALPDEKELSITKRLWLDSLKRFSPETILRGGKAVIEASEFLPTLRTMIRHCEEQENHGLPDAHKAYLEACRAPSPKANYAWSHPAVYYAGKNCDWYFLQTNSEDTVFPIFKKEYEQLCQKVMRGELLPPPHPIGIEHREMEKLDKETNLSHLEKLRRSLEI